MKSNKIKLFLFTLVLSIFAIACSISVPISGTQIDLPTEISPAKVGLTPDTDLPTVLPVPTIEESSSERISLPEVTAPAGELSLTELYEVVNPAVVNILTYGRQADQVVPSGQGSGFLYDFNGDIITNAHVVHGSDELEAIFSDGTILKAEIVGEDLHSDLAVIHVNSVPEGVNPLPLGNVDDAVVGQEVIAIGNPFGLGGTLTSGIISAKGRTIPALTPFSIPESIQTDAAINPGNSGGPLLNMRGEVIGVNAQIETNGFSRSNSGVGFAIPVSIVKRVIPELIADGKYDWAWLGVVGGDVTPSLVEAMNLPVTTGAYISDIADNGPAQAAGLEGSDQNTVFEGRQLNIGGDVITAINGQPVNSFGELLVYIAMQVTPEDEVTLTVYTDGAFKDIKLQLDERPESLDIPEISIP